MDEETAAINRTDSEVFVEHRENFTHIEQVLSKEQEEDMLKKFESLIHERSVNPPCNKQELRDYLVELNPSPYEAGYYEIRELTPLEQIDFLEDSKPMLEYRKAYRRIVYVISTFCYKVIHHPLFEAFIFLTILANTVTLAMEDPTKSDQDETLMLFDTIFLYIYTIEAALKILALGLIMKKTSYFRDNWNVLDFTIVLTGWLEAINLTALRTLRVLRPLRSISSVQGMRVLIEALIKSTKPLTVSFLILVFIINLFAIAGLQLWMGLLRYRCMNINTGELSEQLCGSAECPGMSKCVEGLDNPNEIGFDNYFLAMIIVFQVITLEAWSDLLIMSEKIFGEFSIAYFLPLIFIGAFILLNFSLAVIKTTFSNEMDKETEENTQKIDPSSKYTIVMEEDVEPPENNYVFPFAMYFIEKDEIEKKSSISTNVQKFTSSNSEETTKKLKEDVQNMNGDAKAVILDTFNCQSDSAEDINPVIENEKKNTSMTFLMFYILTLKYSAKEAFFMLEASAKKMIANDEQLEIPSFEDVNVDTGNSQFDMSAQSYRLWAKSCFGYFQKLSYCIGLLVNHKCFINAITLAVILNTIVLAMDHHGISESMESVLDRMNFIFTVIFIVEMGLKLLGLGIVGYFRDKMNYLDASVVIFSIIELALFTGSNSPVSAFRMIRIFRTFRVIRVARIFRRLKTMAVIIRVLSNSINSFMYLALLLLVFSTIFALLGMQLFGGRFEGSPRANFDSFNTAFVTVFQVLSLENWPDVQSSAIISVGYFSVLYFVAWICIGNFILLNLFIAVLLDSFEEKEEDNDDLEPQSKLFKSSAKIRKFREMDNEENSEIDALVNNRSTTNTSKPLFYKIGCQKSFFLFSKENKFRVMCYRISTSMRFEVVIIVLICMSSIKLVLDTYFIGESDDSAYMISSNYIDLGFTVCFTIELLIKTVSLGFIEGKNSYIRDSWNQLDFLLVVLSWVEISISSVNLPYIKVFRMLRTLRPLRFVSHILSMKLVVTALFTSMGAIVNVIAVLIIVWIMFAIVGVSLFKGKFYYCNTDPSMDRDLCEDYGNDWVNSDSNFDNIFEALLSLFIVSSLEGWPDIMYKAIDATEVGQAPERDNNIYMAYFFIFFIMIGAFFMLNFFVGVVFLQFNKAKKEEKFFFMLTPHQLKWIEMQRMIVSSTPTGGASNKVPSDPVRLFFYRLSKHIAFEIFIMACILLNMVQMAMVYYGAPASYVQTLEFINIGFTVIFCLEALFKITGHGFRGYFSVHWNQFDFLVVLSSLLDLFLAIFLNTESSFLRLGPQLARVIKVLRVSRLVRIVKSLQLLQDLFTIIVGSLPAVLNVLSLLFLVFFIYAVLGVFIYYDLESGELIDSYTNFRTFGEALKLLIRVATGEMWSALMYECAEQKGSLLAAAYYGSFITINGFVMLNLFVMVVLQNYEDYKTDAYQSIKHFQKHMKYFKKIWIVHSSRGFRIHHSNLLGFVRSLESQAKKIDKNPSTSKALQMMSAMDIKTDENGYVYYNDMLFAFLKQKFGLKILAGTSKIVRKIIKKEIQTTKKKLKKIREKMKKKSISKEPAMALLNVHIPDVSLGKIFWAWKSFVETKKSRKNKK